MAKSDKKKTPLFNPGKAQWLQKEGHQDLSQEQQAILLAMSQLEAELGRDFSEEETQAIESLTEQLQGFDPEDLTKAVREMVTKPADPARQTSWPELKRRKDNE